MKECKFKIGDRVHVVDAKDLYYGQIGVVIGVTDEEPMYRIQLDDGGDGWEYEKDLEEVTIPKYRPGDRFVIEVESVLTGDDGKPLYKIKGFNALVFDDNGLDRLERAGDEEARAFRVHYYDVRGFLQSAKARADLCAENIDAAIEMLEHIKAGDNG